LPFSFPRTPHTADDAMARKKKGGGGGAKGRGVSALVKQVTQERQKAAKKRAREKKEAAEREAKKLRVSRERATVPYRREQRVLLLGEGNFSFAAALARMFGVAENLVCTAYDSREAAAAKYPQLEENLAALAEAAAPAHFGIDARELHQHTGWKDDWADEHAAIEEAKHREWGKDAAAGPKAEEAAKGNAGEDEEEEEEEEEEDPAAKPGGGKFDVIVFNFPHLGQGQVAAEAVQSHQDLLSLFFASAKRVLKEDGKIHVTLRPGEPYSLWKLPRLAHVNGYRVLTEWDFHASLYPGYEHRRTKGGTVDVTNAHTHVFCRATYNPKQNLALNSERVEA
jgi:25S rRNA (uracil2634-N3)-methyltransferase